LAAALGAAFLTTFAGVAFLAATGFLAAALGAAFLTTFAGAAFFSATAFLAAALGAAVFTTFFTDLAIRVIFKIAVKLKVFLPSHVLGF
jgi:hypothetical protein